MTSQLSGLTHKLADKIEQLGNKNNQSINNSSTNYGPHSSNVANKVDPRIDSDRDGRNDPNSRIGGYGNTQAHDNYGTTGVATSHNHGSTTNNPAYDNPQSTNAGPHGSNLMNKIDPRVDSDRDGRNDPTSRVGGYGQTQQYNDGYGQTGAPGYQSHTGPTHTTTTTTHGLGHNTTTSHNNNNPHYDNPQSTNAGPHNSNLLNKLDPRVDSDRDGRNDPTSRQGGYGQTQTGYGQTQTGYADNTGYGSNVHGNQHGVQGYTGTNQAYDNPQSTNNGPHKSNLMNKLDPRVDSDQDGRDNPNARAGGYGNTQTGGPGHY